MALQTLFEMTEELHMVQRVIEEMAAENDGEITDEQWLVLEAQLRGDIDKKALSWAKFILATEADAAAIEEREKALKARRQAMEAKAEHMRVTLGRVLAGIDPRKKVKDSEVEVSVRTTTAASVLEEAAVPEDYASYSIALHWARLEAVPEEYREHAELHRSVSKAEILKDLRQGIEIPGAILETRLKAAIK